MSQELKPLRKILARAVAAAGLQPHAVAEALGLSVRAWERILSGEQILYVRHLLALARLLGVPPGDFLETGFPEARRRRPAGSPAGSIPHRSRPWRLLHQGPAEADFQALWESRDEKP